MSWDERAVTLALIAGFGYACVAWWWDWRPVAAGLARLIFYVAALALAVKTAATCRAAVEVRRREPARVLIPSAAALLATPAGMLRLIAGHPGVFG